MLVFYQIMNCLIYLKMSSFFQLKYYNNTKTLVEFLYLKIVNWALWDKSPVTFVTVMAHKEGAFFHLSWYSP